MLALALGGAAAAADLTEALPEADFSGPVSEGEMALFPARVVDGEPAPGGLRHWRGPVRVMDSYGCYVSWIVRTGDDGAMVLEKWENEWGRNASERGLIVESGPSLANIGTPTRAVDGYAIDDVFTPAAPGSLAVADPPELSPLRGFTRTSLEQVPGVGYVAFVCVCPDYLPGSVNLLPAILTSPDGRPGSWTYHGILKGEPLEEVERLGRPIWSDGGSLLRLADGTWRAYVNGFGGATLCALEAETLDGPWRFLRDADGAIRDLLPAGGVPLPGSGTCFPHVIKVADDEWHCWMSDGWPVQSIWHYSSADGLAWQAYGQQPEITRAAANGRGIKCLRVWPDPDGETLLGFLSVWGDGADHGRKGWRLHTLRLPKGLQPAENAAP